MNCRISFFSIETSMSCGEILSALLEMRYTDNKSSGFLVSKLDGELLKAKHVSKTFVVNEVVSPFGTVEKTEIVDYLVNEFEISCGVIKIFNPTRSLAKFRRDLIRSLSGDCVISQPIIDLKDIVLSLSNKYNMLKLESVDLFSSEVIPLSMTNMSISSDAHLLESIDDFFSGKDYKMKKVSFCFPGLGNVELSRKGIMKIVSDEDELHQDVIDLLVQKMAPTTQK